MKTNLNRTIETEYDAIEFLTELYQNKEDYHPEDDAHDIVWRKDIPPPTIEECDLLNALMESIYKNTDVDPCEVLLDLHNTKNSKDEVEKR